MKGTLYAAFVVKMVPIKMFFIVVLTASVILNSPLSKFSLYLRVQGSILKINVRNNRQRSLLLKASSVYVEYLLLNVHVKLKFGHQDSSYLGERVDC